MYFVVYPILYLFSLLPFFVLYRLADLVYFLMYYVAGYRKKIVLDNIAIAFPTYTLAQKKNIAKKFYRNLADTFIETIRMLSMSQREFEKRCTTNFDLVANLEKKGKIIQFQSGHQMNWELANWVMSKQLTIPFIGVYKKISSKAINTIFYRMRTRYNTVLVSTEEFKKRKQELLTGQYSLALAADQNGNPANSYWLNFFTKAAPFVTGPAVGAIKNNSAIVFVEFQKPKRGYYHFHCTLMAENAADHKPQALTLQYRDLLEKAIINQPDNYLWSHRRWRHIYNEKYNHFWIDNQPPL
jgi:Kdo2-lipid IVA lauroyltransferase/acyltransferase